MSRRRIALFSSEHDVVEATRECREAGFLIEDVYTPYAVHGLDEAMGLRRSRLTWVAFIGGALAFIGMLAFQGWTSAVDWPLIIGGKEPFALPAFIPVAFEAMVLTAALSTMIALFVRSRLRPGKQPELIDPRTTDDRFALVLLEVDAAFDSARADAIFDAHHAETRRWQNIASKEDTR